MNQNEYEWVRNTRKVLLSFCDELNPNDFTHQNGFGWQNVRDTLVHIADCYHAWLGSFLLLETRNPITSKQELAKLSLEEIKLRFQQVDSYVEKVFEEFKYQMNEPIQRQIPWRKEEQIVITPSKLLMHTVTHEFHHKGQIMAMARTMGYEPPNTDVLGVED